MEKLIIAEAHDADPTAEEHNSRCLNLPIIRDVFTTAMVKRDQMSWLLRKSAGERVVKSCTSCCPTSGQVSIKQCKHSAH